MKSALFVLLLFLWSYTSLAQYNDSIFHHVNLTSAGNYNQTNFNRSFLLNNALSLGLKKKALVYNLNHKWLYGKQNGILVNNDFSGQFDVNLYKTFPSFNYWGLLTYNKIYSLRINNQLQSGLGMAYNILETGQIRLNVSDGILYDYSDVYLKDSVREIYETPRNSFRVQLRYSYENKIRLTETFYLQHSLEYGNDVIYRNDLELSIRLRKWLSFTSKFNYNRMTRTQRETILITYGITFDRYF